MLVTQPRQTGWTDMDEIYNSFWRSLVKRAPLNQNITFAFDYLSW